VNETPTHDANRYAPPVAAVEDIRADGSGLALAGRGQRLAAAVIDVLILLAVLFVVGLVTSVSPFDPTRGGIAGSLVVSYVLGMAAFVAVHGWLLATQGQTVGKKLLGLRIVRTDGSRAAFGRVFGLRYALNGAIASIPIVGTLYALIDALLIFRDSRQCLHDQIADTIVVKA
jgi:uncharacterized RDD family membrane protein YckC